MSKKMDKGPAEATEICTIAEFRERYLPIMDDERAKPREPEDIGAKLAKESLDRLQLALSSLNQKTAT